MPKMTRCILMAALLSRVSGLLEPVKIGGLFDGDDESVPTMFEKSAEAIGSVEWLSGETLQATSHRVGTSCFQVEKKAFEISRTCGAAIFGPRDKITSSHVQGICDTMDVPLIAARWDPEETRGNTVNLYPHAQTLSAIYLELVKELDWKAFTVLYEDTNSLIRTNRLLKRSSPKGHAVTVRRLGSGPDFRDTMRRVKESADRHIVVDCSIEILPEVLRQAQQIGIITDRHSYIVTSLDLQTVDLEPYQYSGVNLTGVRIVDPENPLVRRVFEEPADAGPDEASIDLTKLLVEPALVYDAVQLVGHALGQLGMNDTERLYCNDSDSWKGGSSLLNYLKSSETRGLTGTIKLDAEGFRTDFRLDVMGLNVDGLEKIGTWNSNNSIEWLPRPPISGSPIEQSLRNTTFIVLIALTAPYGMLKKSEDQKRGNDQYEGFGIDIIQELAKMLGFNYTFQVQADSVYGSYNRETGKWNGMIRKLIDNEADLAITDLTITSDRESAVDFTMPFMSLGISILYRKPSKAPPSLFSFLLPFSKQVWLYLMGAFIFVTLLLFVNGRLCPAEWNNPYPCVEEPDQLENQLTLKNSFWFTIGSIMQQGSEIAPIGISTRMVASCWWFFCLIMVSSYTANLAAFLTSESNMIRIRNAEDLANQAEIKYGAKGDGSTFSFFKDSNYSTYKKMYDYMVANAKEVLTKTNEEGIDKVLHEDYAFLMESSSIEYVSERKCNISQVGGLLDAKGYGIAMKKNAPYRNALSTGVLKLQESGVLYKLKTKWWKEKRGGGKCSSEAGSGDPSPLELANVGGIFLVLVVGVALSFFITVYELLWHVGCTSCKEEVSTKEELIEEVKFIVKCSGTTKPVRRRKVFSTKEESQEGSAEGCSLPYGFVPTVVTTCIDDDK